MASSQSTLKVALAQIEPVWLNRSKTLEKILSFVSDAASKHCDLVAFGEGLLPGYPFWLENTDGARFNSQRQKAFHAHYIANAVQVEAGHLEPLCKLAKQESIAVYLGMIEQPADRGKSIYATLAFIDAKGVIRSTHRKLMPTYEERLTWSPGDGHGLRTHSLKTFCVGGLNCWENWMPLARASLYGQGENVHVAVWPGSRHNTEDITPFIAREGRSYALSVSGLMSTEAIGDDLPEAEFLREAIPSNPATGGSCIAAPDGSWVLEPQEGEGLFTAELQLQKILEERQNFDAAGHYSRPDVLSLTVNRSRQKTVLLED